jgi:hypothetical protein
VDNSVLSGHTYYYKVVADNGEEKTRSGFSDITRIRAKVVDAQTLNTENSMLSSMKSTPVQEHTATIERSHGRGVSLIF